MSKKIIKNSHYNYSHSAEIVNTFNHAGASIMLLRIERCLCSFKIQLKIMLDHLLYKKNSPLKLISI